MKKYSLLFLLILSVLISHAKDYSVTSPSGRLTVNVSVEDEINYSVFMGNTEIISPSAISLSIDNEELGQNAKVKKAKTTSVDEVIIPVLTAKICEN